MAVFAGVPAGAGGGGGLELLAYGNTNGSATINTPRKARLVLFTTVGASKNNYETTFVTPEIISAGVRPSIENGGAGSEYYLRVSSITDTSVQFYTSASVSFCYAIFG